MLKMIPDPPPIYHHFEDLLAEASEHSTCAHAVVHQALLMPPLMPARRDLLSDRLRRFANSLLLR